MKNKRKSILIFSLFWAIGLFGGYYLGVDSGVIPTENIEYSYFFSENKSDSEVESIHADCAEPEEAEEDSTIHFFLKSLKLESIPSKIFQHLFSPSACNKNKDEKKENKKLV